MSEKLCNALMNLVYIDLIMMMVMSISHDDEADRHGLYD